MAGLRKVALVVSAMIVLAAAGTGFYLSQTVPPGPSSTTTVTTSSSSTVLSTTTAASSLGLSLEMSVNATQIPSQDAISFNATVFNTLPSADNLTAADDWAVQGLSSGPCDLDNFPVGFGVFRGTYGLGNISSAGRPLFVWAEISCPAAFVSVGSQFDHLQNITSYSLQPGSDNGTYAGYYAVPTAQPPPVCNSGVCTYTQTPPTYAKGVFGMRMFDEATVYAANGTGFYDSLHSALPANYTLVAGDEWGQISLLHFQVVPSLNLPKVGSFLASGGGCAENDNPAPCWTSGFSGAFIFNCAAAAATPAGCTAQVPSSGPWSAKNYTITVHYPDVGQPGEPASSNCMLSVPGVTTTPWAYCFMVNATSFAVSDGQGSNSQG